MVKEVGRVPAAQGSREPSPQAVSALSGFDPSRVALEQAKAFIAVMFGSGPNAVIPEQVPSPLGPPIKLGPIMRDVEAALQSTGRAACDCWASIDYRDRMACPLHGAWAIAKYREQRPAIEGRVGWTCAARKQSLPEPGECDWPLCGCDPAANKVVEALEECGALRDSGSDPNGGDANAAPGEASQSGDGKAGASPKIHGQGRKESAESA